MHTNEKWGTKKGAAVLLRRSSWDDVMKNTATGIRGGNKGHIWPFLCVITCQSEWIQSAKLCHFCGGLGRQMLQQPNWSALCQGGLLHPLFPPCLAVCVSYLPAPPLSFTLWQSLALKHLVSLWNYKLAGKLQSWSCTGKETCENKTWFWVKVSGVIILMFMLEYMLWWNTRLVTQACFTNLIAESVIDITMSITGRQMTGKPPLTTACAMAQNELLRTWRMIHSEAKSYITARLWLFAVPMGKHWHL